MFNQQKYKKNSQDAKPGNKFIGDTTALRRTQREVSCKEQKSRLTCAKYEQQIPQRGKAGISFHSSIPHPRPLSVW